MDIKELFEKDKQYYTQDFKAVEILLNRIRIALAGEKFLDISDLDLSQSIPFDKDITQIYISLFQKGGLKIRFGSKRETLKQTLNRVILKLRENSKFSQFDIKNSNDCKLLFEFVTSKHKINSKNVQSKRFTQSRFELGITGFEIRNIKEKQSWFFMPTDAIINSTQNFLDALKITLKSTPIAKLSNSFSERNEIFFNSPDYDFYLTNSRAFLDFNEKCYPLYRGFLVNAGN